VRDLRKDEKERTGISKENKYIHDIQFTISARTKSLHISPETM
jgi:hypothetical protein